MTKIVDNPDFTENDSVETDAVETEEGDEEEKQIADDESSEEGDQSEASTDEEPGDQDELDDADADVHSKETELAALERDHGKIVGDTSLIDEKIRDKKREIVEARKARREKRDELRGVGVEEGDDTDVDLSDIDPDDVTRVQKILRAGGYVPKTVIDTELYKQTQSSVEDEFFTTHPEYLPENDEDDKLYNTLRQEVALYAVPRNAKEIKNILLRAHRVVQETFPSRFPRKIDTSADKVSKAKKSLAGLGSGHSGTSPKESASQITQAQRRALLDAGFSEEEINEM